MNKFGVNRLVIVLLTLQEVMLLALFIWLIRAAIRGHDLTLVLERLKHFRNTSCLEGRLLDCLDLIAHGLFHANVDFVQVHALVRIVNSGQRFARLSSIVLAALI